MKKATKTVACFAAVAATLLMSAGASVASSGMTGGTTAGRLVDASPRLCAFYQKKFDAILEGGAGSVDQVMRNAKLHGCIINGA